MNCVVYLYTLWIRIVLTFNAVGELEVCVIQTLGSGGSRGTAVSNRLALKAVVHFSLRVVVL